MHKMWVSNDQDIVPWCMTGRTGDWDANKFVQWRLYDLAMHGGKILGLQTADPVLAGTFNRKYGVHKDFKYNNKSEDVGFYQMNHANAGIYRHTNYMIVAKGFNNQLWGAEIYQKQNRFGRYQSYGALTVIKPGGKDKNGFDNKKWDWNYQPGGTTKVLPWKKLIAPTNRIDQRNKNPFAGSLAYDLKDTEYLKGFIGNYGMFSMDFNEVKGLGFSGSLFPDSHDPSFRWKKTVFFFGDMVLCLGSNINHNDS